MEPLKVISDSEIKAIPDTTIRVLNEVGIVLDTL